MEDPAAEDEPRDAVAGPSELTLRRIKRAIDDTLEARGLTYGPEPAPVVVAVSC